MARTIEISVRDRIAWQTNKTEYICGNGDFVVNFTFDKEWDKRETKTARFINGDEYVDVSFIGNQCPVPVIYGASTITVGVYAGNLQTTGASVKCKRSILTDKGMPMEAPAGTYKTLKLEDRVTGKEYAIYIDNGKLMMEEA